MLDDDFLPLDGYTPTILTGSRSSSMRKVSKKEQPPKPPAKPPTLKPPPPKDDFDDLLQQLTEKVEKRKDPPPSALATTKATLTVTQPANNLTSTRNLASENNLDMMWTNESFYPSSNKPSTTNQLGAIEEKKQERSSSGGKQSFSLSGNNAAVAKQSFSLNDTPLTKTVTLGGSLETAPQSKWPATATTTIGKKDDILEEDTLHISNSRSGAMMKPPLRNRTISNNQDNESKPKETLTLNLDRPEVREARPTPAPSSGGSKDAPSAFQPTSNRQDRKGSYNLLPPAEAPGFTSNTSLPRQAVEIKTSPSNTPSIGITVPVAPSPSLDQLKQQHKKELDLVKETYERQLKFLNEQMEKVLKQEKQSKERIMQDFKEMMAKQKERNEKLLKQQVQRTREMASWQREKMQTMYKSEVASLKNQLDSMKSHAQNVTREDPHTNAYEKRRLEDLQEKLKLQLENIEGERKRIQKMESDFEERQLSFKKYRQQEQQKLKEEYTRISEKESKGMRRVAEAMREVSEQKQRLAMEMASMELQLNRKKEDLQYFANSIEVQRQTFDKGKQEMENFNNQIYNSYRLKMQEAEESKRRALQAQNELVNKLRIVQLKAKEIERQVPTNDFSSTETALQPTRTNVEGPKTMSNNWLGDRGTSADRIKQLKESDRFKQVEQYVNQHGLKNRTNPSQPSASAVSKFNLSEFMMGMDKYSKARTGVHPNRVNIHT